VTEGCGWSKKKNKSNIWTYN